MNQQYSKQPKRKRDPISGWVILDKPLDLTSTQAVGIVRSAFNAKKAGHAGTLDPLATGVLPLALGEATKTVAYMMAATKEYEFTIRWGEATSTDDLEGDITETSDVRPTQTQVEQVLGRFVGEISQRPPVYSAIKVKGQRSYDLARKGKDVKLASRKVIVHNLSLLKMIDSDHAQFHVKCGKGFYIRALARDLALALGTFGHTTLLRRTRVGPFHINDAISLEKLDELRHSADFLRALQPVEKGLDDIPALRLNGTEAQRLKQGQSISLLRNHVNQIGGRDIAYATCGSNPIAVGEIRAGQFHPIRVFNFPVKGTIDVDYV